MPAASRCLGTAIAGKTSGNVKMVAVGRMYECDAPFGNHCLELGLDLGIAIAGKMSHSVHVQLGDRQMSAVRPLAAVASLFAPQWLAKPRTTTRCPLVAA